MGDAADGEGEAKEGPTFKAFMKTPLLAKPKEIKLPVGGKVKDLKRIMWGEFPRHKVAAVVGGRELKEGDETLAHAGIGPGTTVHIIAKLTAGLVGNINVSISSEDSQLDGQIVFSFLPPGFSAGAPNTPSPNGTPSKEGPALLTRQETEAAMAVNARMREKLAALRKARAEKAKAKRVTAPGSGPKLRPKSAFSQGDIADKWNTSEDSSVSMVLSTPQGSISSPIKPAPSVSMSPASATKALCFKCRKNMSSLQRFLCRCSRTFCSRHRNPERHNCPYDFKPEGRKKIARDNPKSPPRSRNLI